MASEAPAVNLKKIKIYNKMRHRGLWSPYQYDRPSFRGLVLCYPLRRGIYITAAISVLSCFKLIKVLRN